MVKRRNSGVTMHVCFGPKSGHPIVDGSHRVAVMTRWARRLAGTVEGWRPSNNVGPLRAGRRVPCDMSPSAGNARRLALIVFANFDLLFCFLLNLDFQRPARCGALICFRPRCRAGALRPSAARAVFQGGTEGGAAPPTASVPRLAPAAAVRTAPLAAPVDPAAFAVSDRHGRAAEAIA